MLPILFAPFLLPLGIWYLVTIEPSLLYILYVVINVIIDSIFVNYVVHHQGRAELPTMRSETKYDDIYKKRWRINTWKYEKSFYVLFTLYSFISGVISFALICVYTINFCMELTLQLVDHHFDHSDEINRTSFWLWITCLFTVWIYQLYQSDNWFFVAVKEYGAHPLTWFIKIFCFVLSPLLWICTFIYIIATQTEASNTALRGTGLTLISGYFVIFFTMFIALQSLSLLWYNYGDHENTFFAISSIIKGIPALFDFEVNPARFWRVSHFFVVIVFEGIEITVVDDVHFSRDYIEKLFKWMAIQGLVWAFVYFMGQCVIVIFMNSRLFVAFSQPSRNTNKFLSNILKIETYKLFVNNAILSTGPFDEAIFLVFSIFCLERQPLWAIWTLFAFVGIKYMKWYDSAWSLSTCMYWWFTGKRRKCDENFYNYWQNRKVVNESLEFSKDVKAESDFNKTIIKWFFVVFIAAAVVVGKQITPYFEREQVQESININVAMKEEISAAQIENMSKGEYIEMILKLQPSRTQQELNDITHRLENVESDAENAFFIPYPVCSIIGAYNNLNILDLIMFTMIPYLETEEQHQKVLQTWFGDKYEYINYNAESPAFFHIKYKNNIKADGYEYDVIAIRGTKKVHDFTQDLSLFTEVASLQVVSWLFPLTSFLPNPFLRKFIYFTSWNWEKFICWMNNKKYTLFYHKIEKYMTENMVNELRTDNNYKNSIYVVGHSLGGGLAEIVAAKFAHNKYTNVFSFGLSSPGVSLSSQKFDFRSDQLDKTSLSVIPRRDIVPKIDVHGGLKQQIDCALSSFLDCHYGISSFCEIIKSCPKLIQDDKRKVFANCICIDNLGVEYNTFCYGDPKKKKNKMPSNQKQEL